MSVQDMLLKEFGLEVWTAHFESLNAEHASTGKRSVRSDSEGIVSPWEEVEIPTLENLRAASATFKTPKKLKLGSVLSDDSLPVTTRPDSLRISKVEPLNIDDTSVQEKAKIQKGLQTILSKWNDLNANFQMIYQAFDSSGLGETKYRNVIAETLNELQVALRSTDARLQLVGAGIGRAETDTEEGPMSVWEAIGTLCTKGALVSDLTDGHHLYLDELMQKMPNWEKTLEGLASSYRKNIPQIGKNLNALGTRLESLESKSKARGSSSNAFVDFGSSLGLNTGAGDPPGVPLSEFEDMRNNIEDAFDMVKASIRDLEDGSSPHQAGPGIDYASAGLGAKVDKALKRLGEIEGRATGESFSLNGQVFRSRTEVADWLVAEKVPSCGFFWALFSAMVSMKPKQHSGKERSDENYSARRTKSTTLENNLGAAMTHVRPEVLYAKKGSGELESLSSGFAACSSHSLWVTGSESYRNQVTEMLDKFIEGVLGTVPPTATYQNLVNNLMGSIRMQWHNMCTFIDSFYVELTGVAGFNKEKAWKLVGRCVAALFSAMEPYRSPVTMLEDMNTLDNKAACIWAVLQCHRVGKAFDLVKYRGHPAVVKEMSLFMLTERVDPSEIEACTDRSKRAEKEASDAKSEVAKLKDLVGTLNRELKTAQADIKAFKAKK